MNSILLTLQESLDRLYEKERQLAVFILAHPHESTRMSILELAERSGASAATISRFCRAHRFGGFGDFKMMLAAELAAQPSDAPSYQDIVSGADIDTILHAVSRNHIRSITETVPLLDPAMLKKTIAALQQARQIDLYGMATSGVVAGDFYQKLVRLGRRASVFTDSHLQITSASTLGKGDVVLAVSYSGETREIVDAVSCANDQGATTISLTKHGQNSLSSITSLQLYTSTLEEGIRRGDMASRIAQLYVLDVLFNGLLSASFDEYTPKLENSYQLVRKYRKSPKGR